ncbi:MAG: potassium-transporting ATPase subunit C [Fusobacterium sp.]|nr:potassium-transporting ATPase subunit C [Fusobacterium sp.]MDO5788041.1 potassium-transporting ATPase subunit C [Fusobacterium sp.]
MESKSEILKKSVYITVALFILAIIYTCVINGFAQIFFNHSANGSIIIKDGQAIGSKHIGQLFTDAKHFHGRLSAYNYNTYTTEKEAQVLPASGGTNLGLSNPAYTENIKANIEKLLVENPGLKVEDIPVEMLTASGSGLDPHITIQGAMIQVDRVAKENGIAKDKVVTLINKIAHKDTVNVLELNLALEELTK